MRYAIVVAAGSLLLAACAPQGRYDAPAAGSSSAREPVSADDYRAAAYQGDCPGCGTVERIEVIEEGSRGIGAGAILGTIAGGVLGSQVGSGTGRTAATIAGAAAGGYAGQQVEQRYGGRVDYRVVVDLQDGGTTAIVEDDRPRVRVGQSVQVLNGSVVPRR